MIVYETPLEIFEGNDPVKQIHLTVTFKGVQTDYDFTAVTELEFRAKKGVSTSDEDEYLRYTMTGASPRVVIVDPATAGLIEVHIDGDDIPAPGVYRYRIDSTKAGRVETVMFGPLIVQNT